MSESTDTGPRLSSALIRFAARLAPSDQRDAWLKDWRSVLWHAYFGLLRDGVPEEDVDRQLLGLCAEAFRNAGYLRLLSLRSAMTPKRLLAHPRNALILIALVGVVAAVGTGGFRNCRGALRGLPYPQSGNLIMLRRAAMVLGMNATPSARLAEKWTAYKSPNVQVAAYTWDGTPAKDGGGLLVVSNNFFEVLGMKPSLGKEFSDQRITPEIVLTYDTWRARFGGQPDVTGKIVDFRGEKRVVAGVMPRSFWFLRQPIAGITRLDAGNAPRYVNALGRLSAPDKRLVAETELANTDRRKYIVHVEATFLQERVRRPLVIAGYAALSTVLIALLWALLRRVFPGGRSRPSAWFTAFFVAKASGSAIVISAVWAEFVTGRRIAESGAVEMSALLYLAVLVGLHIGSLAWSYYDQEKRCRTCCLAVALPVTFGTWSSMLLDQPAVESLCPNGHGSLFEPELNAGSGERPTWTSFDDSWRGAGVG